MVEHPHNLYFVFFVRDYAKLVVNFGHEIAKIVSESLFLVFISKTEAYNYIKMPGNKQKCKNCKNRHVQHTWKKV